MRRRRARLSLFDTLYDAFVDGRVEALAFHPDTSALAGFWDRQGALCIGPEYSLDEATKTSWVLRELAEPRRLFDSWLKP